MYKKYEMSGILNKTLQFGSKRVKIRRELAKGGCAIVYLGAVSRTLYAVKCINTFTPGSYAAALSEIRYHIKYMVNSCVVKVYGILNDDVFIEPTSIALAEFLQNRDLLAPDGSVRCTATTVPASRIMILMEYCEGGNLVQLMNRLHETFVSFSERFIRLVFLRILRLITAMHEDNVRMQDLKLENVLLSTYMKITNSSDLTDAVASDIRVCDFGGCTSKCFDADALNGLIAAGKIRELRNELDRNTTLIYRPPEYIDLYHRIPITCKADIFTIGIMIYRMMFFTIPFLESDALAKYNISLSYPETNFSPTLFSCLEASLVTDPSQRCSAKDLISILMSDGMLNSHETSCGTDSSAIDENSESTRASVTEATDLRGDDEPDIRTGISRRFAINTQYPEHGDRALTEPSRMQLVLETEAPSCPNDFDVSDSQRSICPEALVSSYSAYLGAQRRALDATDRDISTVVSQFTDIAVSTAILTDNGKELTNNTPIVMSPDEEKRLFIKNLLCCTNLLPDHAVECFYHYYNQFVHSSEELSQSLQSTMRLMMMLAMDIFRKEK